MEAAREQTLQMEQQKENLRKSILLMEKLRKVQEQVRKLKKLGRANKERGPEGEEKLVAVQGQVVAAVGSRNVARRFSKYFYPLLKFECFSQRSTSPL